MRNIPAPPPAPPADVQGGNWIDTLLTALLVSAIIALGVSAIIIILVLGLD